MRVVTTTTEFRAALDEARSHGECGVTPTMGSLHAGHLSLMERSVAECATSAATIFVNPLQFADDEDLEAYPRDLDQDTARAAEVGVDIMFIPELAEMYPEPVLTTVSVGELSTPMEGVLRPTHFDGVATVVAKLFAIAGPCRAYFGEKDFQQLAVIRRMARDLSFPVEVVGCPIVREADGLALSSRNTYLTPDQRAAAPVLHRALELGRDAIEAGERSGSAVEAVIAGVVEGEPRARLDYSAAVDPAGLAPLEELRGAVRILVAAQVGRPRLLDNLGVTVPNERRDRAQTGPGSGR